MACCSYKSLISDSKPFGSAHWGPPQIKVVWGFPWWYSLAVKVEFVAT